jgi:hypothetical protein
MNISTLLSSNNPMYLAFVGFVGTVLLLIMYNINPILVPALIVAFYIFYVISIINPNKQTINENVILTPKPAAFNAIQ